MLYEHIMDRQTLFENENGSGSGGENGAESDTNSNCIDVKTDTPIPCADLAEQFTEQFIEEVVKPKFGEWHYHGFTNVVDDEQVVRNDVNAYVQDTLSKYDNAAEYEMVDDEARATGPGVQRLSETATGRGLPKNNQNVVAKMVVGYSKQFQVIEYVEFVYRNGNSEVIRHGNPGHV